MSRILAFSPRQRQASHTDTRNRCPGGEQRCGCQCGHFPPARWDFPAALQANRVRQLARAGLHPQAISLITGWGLLRIERELARGPA